MVTAITAGCHVPVHNATVATTLLSAMLVATARPAPSTDQPRRRWPTTAQPGPKSRKARLSGPLRTSGAANTMLRTNPNVRANTPTLSSLRVLNASPLP